MKRSIFGLAALVVLNTGLLHGFPPAPYYSLYGMIRDQVGQTIIDGGAELVLLKDAVEVGRTPIQGDYWIDQNYELAIRIDANRPATEIYDESAIPANGVYSLVVEMNGAFFYPIEASGTLTVGQGGERVELDLTLGVDSDGDGLPDTWEEWQLYQAGYFPDGGGNWPIELIDHDGDFDGDGQSNFLEYIAGTFAGDAGDRFILTIEEKSEANARFKFYTITGKTYTLDRSTDMQTWERVPFSVDAPGSGSESYRASSVGIRDAYAVPSGGEAKEFYRLTVR